MLPPPQDPSWPVAELIAELEHHLGTGALVEAACDLLAGADRAAYQAELVYLSRHDPHDHWPAYWPRVWGARALLYAWDGSAVPVVVAGLGDEAWRVREMCLKVAVRREIAEAVDGAAALTGHELPRVRGQAVRLLGVVGEHEHLPLVEVRLDDEDEAVRRHAARALASLEERLDVVPPPGRSRRRAGQRSMEDMSG